MPIARQREYKEQKRIENRKDVRLIMNRWILWIYGGTV